MKIQDIKNLDLYRCSLIDINLACKALTRYTLMLINKGDWKSEKYVAAMKLSVAANRAQHGMTPEGFMMGYDTIDRVSNKYSVLGKKQTI